MTPRTLFAAICACLMLAAANADTTRASQIDPLFPALPRSPCIPPFTNINGAMYPSKCDPKSCRRCCSLNGLDYYCDPQTGTCRPCDRCPPGYFSVGCKLGKPRCLSCCAADTPELCKRCQGSPGTDGTVATFWMWDASSNTCVEKSSAGGK